MEQPVAAVQQPQPSAGGQFARPANSVKLFIGQIPKSYGEEELQDLLSAFGPLHDVTVLKDKVTGAHKGCAFVTFNKKEDGDSAIASLHANKVLPGMNNPVQVKYADSELERQEHKLFVGMIPKTANEDRLRQIFGPYGQIEELTIIRRMNTNESKGYGFVRFTTRDSAQNAINRLHGLFQMEGSNNKLVVKFADTAREKEKKKNQQMMAQQQQLLFAQAGYFGMQGMNPALPPMNPSLGAPGAMGMPGAPAPAFSQPQIPGTQGDGLDLSHLISSYIPCLYPCPFPHHPFPFSYWCGWLSFPNFQPKPSWSFQPSWSGIFSPCSPTTTTTTTTIWRGLECGMYVFPFLFFTLLTPLIHLFAAGPPGANLFIYHLPQWFTDRDLYVNFLPFGNVVSSKVFVDKATGQSKCFGEFFSFFFCFFFLFLSSCSSCSSSSFSYEYLTRFCEL